MKISFVLAADPAVRPKLYFRKTRLHETMAWPKFHCVLIESNDLLILPHMSTLPRSKPPQAPRLNIEVDGSDRADNISDGGGILKELEP